MAKNFSLPNLSQSTLLFLFCVAASAFSPCIASAETDYQYGLAAYKNRDYKTAAQYLKRSTTEGNNSAIALLYLGHSYSGSSDKVRAIEAYRKLADNYQNTPEAKLAIECVQRLDPRQARFYEISAAATPIVPERIPTLKTRRWVPQSMPLKFYVSDGLEIPNGGRFLSKEEYRTLTVSFKDPTFLSTLKRNSNYGPEDRAAAIQGINMWSHAAPGLVSFAQTNNYTEADIIVFYCNKITDNKSGQCNYPHELGQPNLIEINLGEKSKHKKENWAIARKMVAAHEFGHALGLEHSPNTEDTMYQNENYTYDDDGNFIEHGVTAADKAALHKLYTTAPGNWMSSSRAK
ncbi:matrixin family metalloprotease [bacterium]|jgi:hypothetical protein|nr:matrixin family metalloprotease [bacterium]